MTTTQTNPITILDETHSREEAAIASRSTTNRKKKLPQKLTNQTSTKPKKNNVYKQQQSSRHQHVDADVDDENAEDNEDQGDNVLNTKR